MTYGDIDVEVQMSAEYQNMTKKKYIMAPPNRELCQQGMPAENDQKKEKISKNSQI